MSVKTTADINLNDARGHVRLAVDRLATIVVEECDGSNEYNKSFRETMRICLHTLIEVRELLK